MLQSHKFVELVFIEIKRFEDYFSKLLRQSPNDRVMYDFSSPCMFVMFATTITLQLAVPATSKMLLRIIGFEAFY